MANVRFFSGTRAQYNKIAVHNPLALYFCTDTRELFKGDLLLTDGIRIVKDLPKFSDAADGVLYYIKETRNGYVLSPDRAEWLQLIYATTASSDIKTISFADVELTNVDGVFSIDRACARRALGFKVPEGNEDTEIEFTTKDYVDEKVANIEISGVDLSDYAKKTDIPSIDGLASESYVDEKVAGVSIDLAGYATESWVENKNYLEPEDLVDYAKKNELFSKDYNDLVNKPEIPSVDGFATEDFVKDEIAKINIPDVSSFITSIPEEFVTAEELAAEGFIKEHQSLDGYATEAYVKNAIAEAELGDKDIDISGLATKDDIKDLASVSYVDEQIAAIEIPEVNFDDYATKVYVDTAIENIPEVDLTDYAKKSDIPVNYLKEIPAEYITESELTAKGYLTEHQDISHLATKEELPDVSNFATKADIPDVSGFITGVPAEYITEEELDAKGYITEHQSLEDYATKQDVADAIADIDFPETDLANYYSKTETDAAISLALTEKANDILFTTNKYVTTAIGGFAIDDNLKDLTLAQIFAKLFGLSDTSSEQEPDTPDDPSVEPNGIIETIKANEIPMYSVTEDSQFSEVSYQYMTFTEETAANAPTASGFYQITNNSGEVIESGYQEVTANNPDVPYIIALPIDVDFNTMVSVQTYDTLEGIWKDDSLNMSNDYDEISALCGELNVEISHIDLAKYTLWADLEAGPSGKVHRFIITE